MDSELDLNDEIQKLHVVATVPHLYQHIVDVNAVGTILGLLSHENSGEHVCKYYCAALNFAVTCNTCDRLVHVTSVLVN